MNNPMNESIDRVMAELEAVGDEIKVQLHLAGMDANDVWTKTLEPRLFEARQHAKEATAASKAAIDEVLAALDDFRRSL
jgi:2,4-dienoyl-CoA reductase-like NADH-dependent reductase (Old Yellow Enzyme family)